MALEKWAHKLLWSSAITQGVIYIVRPMITYRAIELDASATTIGVIAACYALLPVLMALTFGRWVGIVGEGRFVIFGTLGLAISSAALLLAHSIPILILAAALSGTAHLACMVGGQTMVALRAPSDSYEKYFGFYTFSASLGQMVGPIIATLVAGSTGVLPKSTTAAFVAALLFSAVALAPVLGWRKSLPTVVPADREGGTLKSAAKLLRDRRVFGAIYTSMAISSVGDILIVFLPLFGKEKSFSSLSIGIIIAIRAGASMLSRLSLGLLSSHYTTKRILIVSNVVSVAMCAVMGFAPTPLLLGIVVLIAGLSLGVGQPLTMSLVSLATKPEDRALAVSARLTGNRFGQFVLPAGAGVVASRAGSTGVFVALSLLLATTFMTDKS